jgi:hypothetical protein
VDRVHPRTQGGAMIAVDLLLLAALTYAGVLAVLG